MTLYRHRLLDEILADEPEARDHIRSMLREIMIDERAHTGQRRNFIGPVGMAVSRRMVVPMFRLFYRDLPESDYLLDVDKMIKEAAAFEYSNMTPDVIHPSRKPIPDDKVSVQLTAGTPKQG